MFTKHWVDAPTTVRELDSVTVYARMDVHHLYGTSFTLTFPKEKLQLTAEPVIGAFDTVNSMGSLTTMAVANTTGEIDWCTTVSTRTPSTTPPTTSCSP